MSKLVRAKFCTTTQKLIKIVRVPNLVIFEMHMLRVLHPYPNEVNALVQVLQFPLILKETARVLQYPCYSTSLTYIDGYLNVEAA